MLAPVILYRALSWPLGWGRKVLEEVWEVSHWAEWWVAWVRSCIVSDQFVLSKGGIPSYITWQLTWQLLLYPRCCIAHVLHPWLATDRIWLSKEYNPGKINVSLKLVENFTPGYNCMIGMVSYSINWGMQKPAFNLCTVTAVCTYMYIYVHVQRTKHQCMWFTKLTCDNVTVETLLFYSPFPLLGASLLEPLIKCLQLLMARAVIESVYVAQFN
jgi:hypothetical protein